VHPHRRGNVQGLVDHAKHSHRLVDGQREVEEISTVKSKICSIGEDDVDQHLQAALHRHLTALQRAPAGQALQQAPWRWLSSARQVRRRAQVCWRRLT